MFVLDSPRAHGRVIIATGCSVCPIIYCKQRKTEFAELELSIAKEVSVGVFGSFCFQFSIAEQRVEEAKDTEQKSESRPRKTGEKKM